MSVSLVVVPYHGMLQTIKGLDSRKIHLPSHMLPVDFAKIGHEEGVLIPWFAELVVDALHTVAERIADQLLGGRFAMLIVE